MISLSDVTLRQGAQVLFSGGSFQLHHHWKIGLTGENGAGKSSLFRALLGELHPDRGELSLPKEWVIGHMAQEVEALDQSALDYVLAGDAEWWTLNEQIHHGVVDDDALATIHGRFDEIDGYSAPARAARMMDGLGFGQHQHGLPVRSFSGGWRVRLNLARTLMCRSDLLLLDEPTNHLDLDAILWLEDWLKSYPGTLFLISHDRDFLDALTDHVLHIEQQTIQLYSGNYSTFERTRLERMVQQQSEFEKQQRTREHLQKYIDRFKAQATRAKQAQSRIKQLERMQHLLPVIQNSPFQFGFETAANTANPLIRLDHVSCGYAPADGGEARTVVGQVNLHIGDTDRIGILGMNGAGKSTLIKTLAGELAELSGHVYRSEHLATGYFNQHQLEQFKPGDTPFLCMSRLAGKSRTETQLRTFLGSFGFSFEKMDSPVDNFSGGEKSRLALALIVFQKPNLLILDEPTNHLDMQMRDALSLALQDFPGAVIMVSHDRQLISSVCDDLYLVHEGSLARFDQDISAYASWLKKVRATPVLPVTETVRTPAVKPAAMPVSSVTNTLGLDREQLRKATANFRETTRGLRKTIETLEKQLPALHQRLQEIETGLAASEIYEEASKPRLLVLMEEQARLRQTVDEKELYLLDQMEQLENYEKKFAEQPESFLPQNKAP